MKRALIATVLGVAAFAAAPLSAQTISVGSASGAAGGGTTPAQIPVTFTRNAAVPVADFTARVTYNNTNFSATATAANGGACSVNAGAGFVTVLPPPGGSDTPTNIYCNITFTITAGVAAGNYPLNVTTSFGGGGCFDTNANPVACTLTPGQITVTGGGGGAVGPNLAYNPTAGSTVAFTGVTTVGSTGNGTIQVTPSGGSGGGTTTLGSFALSGADAANFAVTSAATLTFTAGVNTPQNVTMTCTSGAALRTATLTASEAIGGGATASRQWTLNCPAGAAAAVPPTITYTPAAGSSINVAAGGNTTIAVGCPTDGSACNGSGTGLAATSRLENLTVAYAGPPFSPLPSNLSCAFVTEAGGAAASPLDFVATAADAGDIRCTCANVVVAEPYTVSVSERIPANSGAVTATRTFNVTCGNGLTCGSIAANPASGTVSLNNGGAAVTATTISVTGISAGVNQTVTCAVSGASAGSTFAVTTVPSPLVLNSVTTSGTVSATCTNSNPTTATATLTCTSAGSAAGCPALSSTYTLSCPGQNAPPPVSTVPVPALSEQGRILLAALVLLLGVGVVGFRLRG